MLKVKTIYNAERIYYDLGIFIKDKGEEITDDDLRPILKRSRIRVETEKNGKSNL